MSSAARQLANTANAQLSTGPRTEDGKARSAQNARKHGLTAAELVIAAEDREEFEELLAQYQTDIRPRGAIQQTLFDQLVEAAWNLRRIRRMETELCSAAASYTELIDNSEIQLKLDRFARHKIRIERTFHRCLKELKELQTNAALARTLPGVIVEAGPPLASASEIAKRTQTLARSVDPLRELDALLRVRRSPRSTERVTRNEQPETS